MWFLLAVVAKVPPVVSLAAFSPMSPIRSSPFSVLGVHRLEFEW
jgi:hypothetical protein